MTKTQEQFGIEYQALEAKETELENRIEELYDERLDVIMFKRGDTSPISQQMGEAEKQLAQVRRDMSDIDEAAGWSTYESEE